MSVQVTHTVLSDTPSFVSESIYLGISLYLDLIRCFNSLTRHLSYVLFLIYSASASLSLFFHLYPFSCLACLSFFSVSLPAPFFLSCHFLTISQPLLSFFIFTIFFPLFLTFFFPQKIVNTSWSESACFDPIQPLRLWCHFDLFWGGGCGGWQSIKKSRSFCLKMKGDCVRRWPAEGWGVN